MLKIHITPLSSSFYNTIQKGLEFIQGRHYMCFEGNKVSISLMLESPNPVEGSITSLINNFRAILRKYRNKYFNKIHLNLNNCSQIDQLAIYNLGLDIAVNFRYIQEFNIVFTQCSDLTDQKLRTFLISITKSVIHLRKLSIMICKCQKITDKGINYFRSLIFLHLKRLENLNINFSPMRARLDNGKNVSLEPNIAKRTYNEDALLFLFQQDQYSISQKANMNMIETITKYFRNQNLRQLTFMPHEDPTPQESTKKLTLLTIQRLKQLKTFYLTFQNFGEPKIGKFEEISYCIGQNMLDLQYLTVDFESYSSNMIFFKSELTQTAANIFSNLPKLRGLALSFGIIEVSEEAMNSFTTKMCEHAKNLEEFIIEVKKGSFISRQGIESLLQHLSQNLPSLKKFMLNTLNFIPPPFGNFSDEPEIHSFSPQSCPALKEFHLLLFKSNYIPLIISEKLEKLTLSFRNCQKMSNNHFKNLIESIFIRSLHCLKELTIVCKNATIITDVAFKALFDEDWLCLVNLKVFKLEISDTESLTDAALLHMRAFVAENLKNIKSLRTVSLAFTKCKNLTRSAIQSFITSLTRNLKSLEELELDFHQSTSRGYTPNDIGAIIDSIASDMKVLKKVMLNFSFKRDASEPFKFTEILDLDKIMRGYLKKLKYVPVVAIDFGPRQNF